MEEEHGEEEEEVKVELEDEEENGGAKRATSRCLDCSDTVNELPVTFAKTKIFPCHFGKTHPFCQGIGGKTVSMGAVALLQKKCS